MNGCKNSSTNGNVYNAAPVPFVVHENMRAQMDTVNLRLIRIIALLAVMLVGTNLFWAFVK